MALTVRDQLISEDKYPLKSPYDMIPTLICIHETGNNASATNEANYMVNNDSEVGFHSVVDDVEAVHCIPFNRNAWHAGDGEEGVGNRNSISVEIAYQTGTIEQYSASVDNAIEYIASLMIQFNMEREDLRTHQEFNGKHCPWNLLDGLYITLEEFKDRIMAIVGDTGGGTEIEAPPTTAPFPQCEKLTTEEK